MLRRTFAWLGLALIFLPAGLLAQEVRPQLLFNFSRQNDFTFATSLQTRYLYEKGNYSLDINLGHTNIYNLSQGSDGFVQLYMRSSIWQHYRLSDELALASWIETDQYFDSRNEKVNLYGGLRWSPHPSVRVTPLIGYAWDVRTAILGRSQPFIQVDQGLTPALLLESQYIWEDQNLAVQSGLLARYKFIDPRRQYNFVAFQYWSKKFQEGVEIQVGARAGAHELDDYQANSVKRIMSDSIMPRFNLSYTFAPGLEWRSENEFLLNRRAFRFQNIVQEDPEENDLIFDGLNFATRQRLSYAKGDWRTYAAYEFIYSSRKYRLENDLGLNQPDFEAREEQERQKDFLKNWHKWDFMARRDISPLHSIGSRLVNQYLQYDSPSEANFDDRDELSWLGSLDWQARWRKSLFTELGLSGNFRHYAFLLSEKSQDNYKQRSLRLDFKFGWDVTPFLRLEGDNGVYVTYNVKDFTDFNKTDRSTRNLETNLRGFWRPGQKFRSQVEFRRKETHQSYLDWARFTETTLDTVILLNIDQQNQYEFDLGGKSAKLFVMGGYRHFNQSKKFKAPMVGEDNLLKTISLRQVTLQTGPQISIGYRDRRRSTIDFLLWMQYQVRKSRFAELEGVQVIGASYFESDLRQRTTELRPYPTLRVSYFFR